MQEKGTIFEENKFKEKENMDNQNKVFSTLRKIDYVWSLNQSRTFCEVLKDVMGGELKELSDEEMEAKLALINID